MEAILPCSLYNKVVIVLLKVQQQSISLLVTLTEALKCWSEFPIYSVAFFLILFMCMEHIACIMVCIADCDHIVPKI